MTDFPALPLDPDRLARIRSLPSPFGEDDQDLYMHGRCQIVALAIHKVHGLPMAALWDPYAEDGVLPGYEGALVHVFAMVDETLGIGMDARGVRSVEDIASEFGEPDEFVLTGTNEDEIKVLTGIDDDDLRQVAKLYGPCPPTASIAAP